MGREEPDFLHPRSSTSGVASDNLYHLVDTVFVLVGVVLLVVAALDWMVGGSVVFPTLVAVVLITGGAIFFAVGTLAADLQRVFRGTRVAPLTADIEGGANSEAPESAPTVEIERPT